MKEFHDEAKIQTSLPKKKNLRIRSNQVSPQVSSIVPW